MKQNEKRDFMSSEAHVCIHSAVRSDPRTSLAVSRTEKMSLPFCSVSVIAVSNSYWSKRAEIKPMLEASLGITECMNTLYECVKR